MTNYQKHTRKRPMRLEGGVLKVRVDSLLTFCTLKTARLRTATPNHQASGVFTCKDELRNKVLRGPRGGILSVLVLCSRAVVNDSDVSPANRMSAFAGE